MLPKFTKVSYKQFEEAVKSTYMDCYSDEDILDIYNAIKTPVRASSGSAGYDFRTPFYMYLAPNDTELIPTGIRCEMPIDSFLAIYPRSGLGFKYRLQLDNTVGIIDSDYFYSDNEGHIFIKVTNCGLDFKELHLNQGDAFAQGVFTKYYLTEDDDAKATRNGGMGSSDKA